MVDDGPGDQVAAVAGDFAAAGGEQLGRGQAVGAEEAVHVGGRSVAGLAGVDDGDAAAARVSTRAADRPAAPPPMTTTS